MKRIIFPNSSEDKSFMDVIKAMIKTDCPIIVEIAPYKEEDLRTLKQNKRYWLIIREVAKFTGSTEMQLHRTFSAMFLKRASTLREKSYDYIQSTTQLTITEFTEYTEQIEQFCMDEWNFILPPPK